MIPTLTIVSICFSVICSLVVPVAVWIYLIKKDKNMNRYILLGMFGFFAAQIVVRVPILQLLAGQQWFSDMSNGNLVLYSLFLSFTTALFETAGRFIILKFIVKNDVGFQSGLGTGFGHGACETLAYVGLTSIVNLTVCIMINTNSLVGNENYEAIKESVASQSPSTFFAAGSERLLAMLIHIGISVIMAYFIKKEQPLFSLCAGFSVHCIYDFTVMLISQAEISVWLTILAMAFFASLITAASIKIRQQEKTDGPKLIK